MSGSPITRASGKKTGAARFVHNDRLVDALMTQAFSALPKGDGAKSVVGGRRYGLRLWQR